MQAVAVRSIATSPVSRGEKTTWLSTSDSRHTQLSRSYSPAKCLSGRGVHNLLWKATVSPWLTSFLSSEKLQRPSVIPQKSIFGIYSGFGLPQWRTGTAAHPKFHPTSLSMLHIVSLHEEYYFEIWTAEDCCPLEKPSFALSSIMWVLQFQWEERRRLCFTTIQTMFHTGPSIQSCWSLTVR